MMHLTDCYGDVFAYVMALVESPSPGIGYDKVRGDILTLLQTAETQAAAAGYDPTDVNDAKFAVCAWVDETVLRSSWEGATRWRSAQLQQLYFQTHNAGMEFYGKLDALLSRKAPPRETFALCLGLGYQGKYFIEDRGRELADLRRGVIRSVLGEDPPQRGDFEHPLFPEAYQPSTAGKRFNPWAFDWWFFCIPILIAIIAAEAYLFLRNDLNIQLLGYFRSLS